MIRAILICRLIEQCIDVVLDKILHVTRTRPNVVITVGMKFKHLYRAGLLRRCYWEYHNVTVSAVGEERVECKVSHLIYQTTCESHEKATRVMRNSYVRSKASIEINGCDVVRHRYNIIQFIDTYDFLKMVENA